MQRHAATSLRASVLEFSARTRAATVSISRAHYDYYSMSRRETRKFAGSIITLLLMSPLALASSPPAHTIPLTCSSSKTEMLLYRSDQRDTLPSVRRTYAAAVVRQLQRISNTCSILVRGYSIFSSSQTDSGDQLGFCRMGIGILCHVIKRPKLEAEHLRQLVN